jgi:hypothetical protein
MKKIAVLTGDIVNSSNLEPRRRKELEQLIWKVLEKLKKDNDKYDVLRGDSVQFLTEEVQQSFRKAIQMRCMIKYGMSGNIKTKIDTRISIGIGDITFTGKTLGSSDGTAFRYSGKGLDQLKQLKKRIIILTGNDKLDDIFNIIAVLTDVIVTGWTAAQAEAVYWSSVGLTQQQIADKLSIVQSAVNNRLKSAHWNEIEEALTFFERHISG